MRTKSFLNLSSPRLDYRNFAGLPGEPELLPPPKTLILHHPGRFRPAKAGLNIGDRVKKGQRLAIYEEQKEGVICPATGTVSAVGPFIGDLGRPYTAVTIAVEPDGDADDESAGAAGSLDLETAGRFFSSLPGAPDFSVFFDPETPIRTLLVSGVDADLLVTTNQYAARRWPKEIKKGLSALSEVLSLERSVLALAGDIVQNYASVGATETVGVSPEYPSGNPRLVALAAMGEPVPAGDSMAEAGIAFMTAEAVAAVGRVVGTGRPPTEKIVTVINKDGGKRLVSVVIGTPIRHIVDAAGIVVEEGDRIILGGPMTGTAVYSVDHPVTPATDALMIQAGRDIVKTSDYPCINCGECNRACPVNIQVNMLVRFLEAGKYEEAEDLYELDACIDCGLCSFVCVSRIPIFQYIRLAKYELNRIRSIEEEEHE